MDNPTQQSSTPPPSATTTPVEQPVSGYGKKNWKKWVVIYVLIGALIYAGIYYFVFSKQEANPYQTNYQISPTPVSKVKTNLNPNTGDLYQDIKMRMKEVLK